MAQYDVDYHSEKAETFRHLEVAARQYLARNARTLPIAQIGGLADEIKDFAKSAQYQVERTEFYRNQLAQAETEGVAADDIIEAETINPATETEGATA